MYTRAHELEALVCLYTFLKTQKSTPEKHICVPSLFVQLFLPLYFICFNVLKVQCSGAHMLLLVV